jgi:hypothetical protein
MPAATAARQGPRPAQNANDKTSLAWTVLKYAGLYFGIQIISSIALRPESPIGKFIGRQAPGPSSGGDVAKEVPVPAVQPQTAGMTATALWSAGDDMTCSVFLSTGETNGPRLPFHRFEPVKYGDWAWSQSWETEFHVPTVGLPLCFTGMCLNKRRAAVRPAKRDAVCRDLPGSEWSHARHQRSTIQH